MVAHATTAAFQGIDAVPVTVQTQMSKGLPSFTIVGLADKAVAESRERIRAALFAIGLSLPPNESSLISHRPICQKREVIMICPSRSPCSPYQILYPPIY